jgi:trimethylamine:corrinoid methyltransferase-like protein
MLSVDEVWSPEQLVLDREIADYAQRIRDGVELDDAALSLEAIRDCAFEGEFLSHSTTLESYRSVYWMPQIFRQATALDGQAHGGPGAWQEARREVRRRIAAHAFALGAPAKRELEQIYNLALRSLV